jgi:cellulose synthase (UDP-forming)
MCIFDADFRPRADFFSELLPYFYDDPTLGLVQSPQYFDVRAEQSWLQRGAGSVQEFFYRFSQVARQSHDAAICVGTNAIYRRDALDATGGTALIEHSEDVHTGFNMRMHGWGLRYVPLILAKGVCPDGMSAFFKQQYRWCMGSMSLLGSRKFWTVRMRLRQRLCYFTGFCYYIHTALTLFVAPLIPLYLLYAAPQEVMARNYLLLLPTTVYTFLIFPLWHRADFGAEAWAVKHAYSWAHLFAIIDVLRRRPMGWTPTGASGGGTGRYVAFRILQALFSFLPSVAWMTLAAQRVLLLHQVVFLPLLFAGLFATYTTGRVACYHERRDRSAAYHHAIDKPTELTHAVGRMERGEEPEKVEV